MAISVKKSITADDVAKLAGVSRWTVARAFKSDGSVSGKARERVMEAARELGYAPNLLASGLASNRTNLVALLVDDFTNPHKLPLIECLTSKLQKKGFAAILVNIHDDKSHPEALVEAGQRQVDAVILIGTGFSDELLSMTTKAQQLPKLIVLARESEHEDTISVCCDHLRAVREMTDYIVERGYERPAYLAGPQTLSTALRRKSSFLSCLARHGLPEPTIIGADRYERKAAAGAVRALLGNTTAQNRPDVLFCENDVLAIGAIDVARHEFGLSIPEDIGILGFDNIDLAASPSYQLTTYEQPLDDMADAVVELLTGGDAPEKIQRFPGKFIVRHSA